MSIKLCVVDIVITAVCLLDSMMCSYSLSDIRIRLVDVDVHKLFMYMINTPCTGVKNINAHY